MQVDFKTGMALVAAFAFVANASAATYYLDSAAGDDARAGTSPSTAWRTLKRANEATFAPGDRILFRAGSKWDGAFCPRGSGREGQPIVIDRYGKGAALPEINGRGKVPAALRLENQSYIEVQNLAITNFSEAGERELRGVEVRARDLGWVKHVHFKHLDIHDINGVSDYTTDGSTHAKSFGGLVTIIEGDAKQTAWDDLVIEDCRVRDVGPIGIVMLSSWMGGHRDNDPQTWFPSRNVVIRGNRIERTARNGLIVRGCAAPLIERNFFNGCAHGGSGNACFAFHCDDALFQFNESCFTRYNPGDTDAAGFDSDYCCRRSVFQFNYSHDNEYGFMVVCNLGPKGFNDGTIVRYNISQNDGGNVFRFSGSISNTKVYNNTVFVGPTMANPKEGHPPRVIYFKEWNKGWSDGLKFYNNAIYNLSQQAAYTEGSSTNNTYRHNLFFGKHPASEPRDPLKSLANPLLVKPGGARLGLKSAAAAYSLQSRAPAFGAGGEFKIQAEMGFVGEGTSVVPDIDPPAGCGDDPPPMQ